MANPARYPNHRARRGPPVEETAWVRRSSERADHGRELVRIERRATDKRTVDAVGCREFTDGSRAHAAPVEDGDSVGVQARTLQRRADGARRRGDVLARRGITGADRPHRLIRDDQALEPSVL